METGVRLNKQISYMEQIMLIANAERNPAVRAGLEKLYRYHLQTYKHSIHVAFIAVQIGSLYGQSVSELQALAYGALLHDIGKLFIPLSVLDKKEKLTTKEYEMIYKHPEDSCRWVLDHLIVEEGINKAAIEDIVLKHHRKLNHTGYPGGSNINDDKLSLLVRIVTVADIFDALISPRSYKRAFSLENALVELYRCVKKKEIDEEVVKILIDQVLIDPLMMIIFN